MKICHGHTKYEALWIKFFLFLWAAVLLVLFTKKRHCGKFLKSSAVHHLSGQTSVYATVFQNEMRPRWMHNASENRCNPNHLAIFSFPGGVSDITYQQWIKMAFVPVRSNALNLCHLPKKVSRLKSVKKLLIFCHVNRKKGFIDEKKNCKSHNTVLFSNVGNLVRLTVSLSGILPTENRLNIIFLDIYIYISMYTYALYICTYMQKYEYM